MQRLIFTLAILFLVSMVSPTEAKPLTLEQLIELKEVTQASISPDGSRIAYVVNVPRQPNSDKAGPDYQELYVIDNKGIARPFLTGKHHIKHLQWSQNSEQIWFLVKMAYEPFYSIYVFSTAGGEAHKVVSRKGHILGFSLSASGNQLLFWHPTYPDKEALERVNLGFNARVVEEEDLNNQLWFVDFTQEPHQISHIPVDGHVMSAKFGDGSNFLVRLAEDYRVDSQVMKSQLLIMNTRGEEQYRVQHQGKLGTATLSPNGEKIVFLGASSPSMPDHDVLMIASQESPKAQILLTNFLGMVTDFAWISDRQILFTADVGVNSFLGRKNVRELDDDYRVIVKNDLVFTSIKAREGRQSAAVIAHHKSHPKELFWLKGNTLVRMTDSNPLLKEVSLPQQASMSFSTPDGLTLDGVLISPEGLAADDPAATILFVHGGPESHVSNGWLGKYSHPVHQLADKGFRSFFPNYRGSSGRGSEFLTKGQQDYAGAEFDDLLAAKSFLIANKLTKEDKVGISGVSYGGYATAWGATKLSEHFYAAVMLSGISNNISKFGTTDIPTEMVQTHAKVPPWENWEFLLQRSPIFYSDKHQTPLLIAHGLKDSRVHFSQSMELFRHLKQRNLAPVRMVTYPEQGHGNQDSHSQLDYSLRLIRWFEHFNNQDENKHLPDAELPWPTPNKE